jgi:hypothetical protein
MFILRRQLSTLNIAPFTVSLSFHLFIRSVECVCCSVFFSHHHHHRHQHLLGFCYTEWCREPMFVDIAMSIYIDIQSFVFFSSSSSLVYWEMRWTCAHNFWLILSVFFFYYCSALYYLLYRKLNGSLWTAKTSKATMHTRALRTSFLLIKSIDDNDDDRLKK